VVIDLVVFFVDDVLNSSLEDDAFGIPAGHFLSKHIGLVFEEVVVVVVYGFQLKVEAVDRCVPIEMVDLTSGARQSSRVEKTCSNILK
jgi:hypothetical protein